MADSTVDAPTEAEEAPKRPEGRPPKFDDPDAMAAAINEYFETCKPHFEWQETYIELRDAKTKKAVVVNGEVQYETLRQRVFVPAKIPTVSGLAHALDTTRRTLLDYEDRDDDGKFSHTIKMAKAYIEAQVENGLSNGTVNPAGLIFTAVNNWGWLNKSQVEADVTSKGKSLAPAPDANKSTVDKLVDMLKEQTAEAAG